MAPAENWTLLKTISEVWVLLCVFMAGSKAVNRPFANVFSDILIVPVPLQPTLSFNLSRRCRFCLKMV